MLRSGPLNTPSLLTHVIHSPPSTIVIVIVVAIVVISLEVLLALLVSVVVCPWALRYTLRAGERKAEEAITDAIVETTDGILSGGAQSKARSGAVGFGVSHARPSGRAGGSVTSAQSQWQRMPWLEAAACADVIAPPLCSHNGKAA